MSAWMLFAIVVSALVAGAAWAADRALELSARPRRAVWMLGLLASIAVPVMAALRGSVAGPVPDATSLSVSVWDAPVAAIERVGAATVSLDVVLSGVWIAMSLGLLAWLGWSYARLKREQAAWTRDVVDGTDVFISRDVGPAVVDPVAGTIVVPRWLLDLAPDARRLALAHERAHVAAGDARLVWIGMLLVAATPWNPLLWWQLHRLRVAIELDCDARVLATGAARKAYAELLVHVGASRGMSLLRPALVEPQSFLGRRISAMIDRKIRARLARSVVYGSLAVGVVFVACDAPAPQMPSDGEPIEQRSMVRPLVSASAAPEGFDQPERVSCPPIEYPRILQQSGIEGTVVVKFIVDDEGKVSGPINVLRSDHRGFEGPTRDMITRCLFRPGTLDGAPVRSEITMPINFTLQRSGTTVRRYVPDGGVGITGIARTPLYVLDGVIMNEMPDLEAEDIHSIEVIKGQLADSLYGERGRNGIVRIRTKEN